MFVAHIPGVFPMGVVQGRSFCDHGAGQGFLVGGSGADEDV